MSIHSAATWLIENQPWDFFAVYYDAIDHFCHGFMRYHPPRQDFIKQEDFELYHNVVSTAYQFHDQMLGALLDKVGDDTTVILMSDHGFHPDHLRPRAIPGIPAGPAIEHRDFGILAIKGPGIKRDELLHGASVLDITPTMLTLYGLPVGEDMDGKVFVRAFEHPPKTSTIPSWEEVAGNDGRHPPHTRLDPVAAHEALEQLVALGYIDRPDENNEKAVAQTVRELRYNLGGAYQDADRHAEALEIFRELHQPIPTSSGMPCIGSSRARRLGSSTRCGRSSTTSTAAAASSSTSHRSSSRNSPTWPDYASPSVGPVPDRCHPRPRHQTTTKSYSSRRHHPPAPPWNNQGQTQSQSPSPSRPTPATANRSRSRTEKPEPLLTVEERRELARWRNLSRFQPPVVEYLMAQVLALEGSHALALETLERVREAELTRPGLFLQTAELYMKLDRWEEAECVFARALEIDPDNPHAHLGMCRMHLRRRDHTAAAGSALEALERLYHFPLAHFFLGIALRGMKEYRRAVGAFRTALSLNPNFSQAHLHLASILGRKLADRAGAAEHRRLYHELRSAAKEPATGQTGREPDPMAPMGAGPAPRRAADAGPFDMPEDGKGVVVVSGLPRSGTSMVMQMLVAGGHAVLSDDLRPADADNPLGYFEFEPVKQMHQNTSWMQEAGGKAVKIVAPLLPYLPAGSACHVIFIERQLDEVLSSQSQMIMRRGESVANTPGRRDRLKAEYSRKVRKVQEFLSKRPNTRVLYLNHALVILDPEAASRSMNEFLGGGLETAAMVAAVNPSLHRNRAEDRVPLGKQGRD